MIVTYPFAPSVSSETSVCAAQTRTGAGPLVLDGALVTGGVAIFGEQAHVTLTSAADLSGVTFTVTGRNQRGAPVVESLAGPDTDTVVTTASFKTVTSVVASATVSADVTVGNHDDLETAWVSINPYAPNKGISVERSDDANYTYELQYSPVPLVAPGQPPAREEDLLAFADSNLTGKTSSAGIQTTTVWPLLRLKITNFVAGSGTLRVSEGPVV